MGSSAMSAIARHPAQPLHADVAAVLDGLDASDGPVESARVLPPQAYMSAAFHEFEMAAVYMRSWLCVGRVQPRGASLPQLKVELWRGFIFVNFDPAARPLAPTLTKLEPYMAGYDLDSMVTIAPEVTAEPVPWNWKMLLENYIEPYHTQFV